MAPAPGAWIALAWGVLLVVGIVGRNRRTLAVLLALRMTGGSVLVCSLTTIIGYVSLLVSDNQAIRGFGIAALIGEITCVTGALTLVPAIVALGRRDVPDPLRS